jgi:hypothetical protein
MQGTFPFTKHDAAAMERLQPKELKLTPTDAFCLLSQLQLALRHPKNVGHAAYVGRQLAEDLQEYISVTPNLKLVIEAGWDPEHDDDDVRLRHG